MLSQTSSYSSEQLQRLTENTDVHKGLWNRGDGELREGDIGEVVLNRREGNVEHGEVEQSNGIIIYQALINMKTRLRL